MAYETLYRKYRPHHFSEVVGQKSIVRSLQNALTANRIAHAYLFCGQRGTGKTSIARLLAMALNCEKGITSEPCGSCSACKSIFSGTSIDVLEIDAASYTGVESVREVIIERVSFLPAILRYRVYIIDEVHMLSTASFNALLKTLEEPPPQVVFVLATTDPHKVPTTVRSRCLRFDFHPIAVKDIVDCLEAVLRAEGWEGRFEQSALWLIARTAQGGLRDALTVLEQAINFAEENLTLPIVRSLLGTTDDEFLCQLLDAICVGDISGLWLLVSNAVESGRNLNQLTRDLSLYLRDLLSYKVCVPSDSDNIRQEMLQRQANFFSEETLMSMIMEIWEIERELRNASDTQLVLEVGLIKLMNIHRSSSASGKNFTSVSNVKQTTQPFSVRPELSDDAVMGQVSATTEQKVNQMKIPVNEGEHNIGHIKKYWETFLRQLKQENVIAYTFLLDAEPTDLQGDRLVLMFKHAFHYDRINDRVYLEAVEQALQETFQISGLKLKPVLSTIEPQPEIGTPIQPEDKNAKSLKVKPESVLGDLFETS